MDSLSLCQVSTGQEDDWKALYESAFPSDERMSVEEVRRMISNGTVVLHKTTNKSGELLCFSIVTLMSNFTLLAYIATDSTKRSTGVGSKHMKKLVEVLKADYATHLGLFLEIESTKESGLDVETQKARTRRLAFYQRLGAKRLLHKTYLMPSYVPGTAARQGELMWVEFLDKCVKEDVIPQVIEEIFNKGYGLPSTDAVVTQVLAQFKSGEIKADACAGVLETAPAPSSSATTDGAEKKCSQSCPPVSAEPKAETPAARSDQATETPATSAQPTAETLTASAEPAAETPAASELPAAETPAASAKPTAETPTPSAESAAETPAASAEPTAEKPMASAEPVAETPAASAKPAAETPTASAEPAAETPAASAKPAAETPAASAKPAAETPAASAKPAAETPEASAEPAAETPTASAEPAAETPASSAKPAAETSEASAEPTAETPAASSKPAAETPAASAESQTTEPQSGEQTSTKQ